MIDRIDKIERMGLGVAMHLVVNFGVNVGDKVFRCDRARLCAISSAGGPPVRDTHPVNPVDPVKTPPPVLCCAALIVKGSNHHA